MCDRRIAFLSVPEAGIHNKCEMDQILYSLEILANSELNSDALPGLWVIWSI